MRRLWGIATIFIAGVMIVLGQVLVHLWGQPVATVVAQRPFSSSIVVDPVALESAQSTGSIVTQTLTIHNLGDSDLEWHIYDGIVALWQQVDNASPSNGAPSQYFPDLAGGVYATDDFTVPAGQSWQIEQIFVPGIYTPKAGPAPSFDVVVYADAAGAPGVEVASLAAVSPLGDDKGDVTLPVSPPLLLAEGSYWLAVNANMDFVGPNEQWFWRTRTVQTGSPYHWRQTGIFGPMCVGVWQPGAAVCGVGAGVDPDLLFDLQGNFADVDCDLLSSLPWLTVTPTSGTVAASGDVPLSVTFNATGYWPDVYTGTLCFASNDPLQPLLAVPLTMTVTASDFAVALSPDATGSGLPGAEVAYTLIITNTGNLADSYGLTVDNVWPTALSLDTISLGAGVSGTVGVTVTVPLTVEVGGLDTAVITAASQADLTVHATTAITTTAIVTPNLAVALSPDAAASALPGTEVVYTLLITNTGNLADSYTLTANAVWTTTLAVNAISLDGGASSTVAVTVTVPLTIEEGQWDTAVITATSQTETAVSASTTITTTGTFIPPAGQYLLYIPFVRLD